MKKFFGTLFKGLGTNIANGLVVWFSIFMAIFIVFAILTMYSSLLKIADKFNANAETSYSEYNVMYNNEEVNFRDKDGKRIEPKIEDGVVYIPIVDKGLFLDKNVEIVENNIYLTDIEMDNIVDFNTETIDSSVFTNENIMSYDYSLIVNWGTWCPDCDKLLGELSEIEDKLLENNIQIIGILSDDIQDIEDVRKKVEEKMGSYNLRMKNIVPTTEFSNHFQTNVDYLPTVYLIDNYRRIIKDFDVENSSLQEVFDEILKIKENSCNEC